MGTPFLPLNAYISKTIIDRENLKDLRLCRIKSSTKVSIESKLSDESLRSYCPLLAKNDIFSCFRSLKLELLEIEKNFCLMKCSTDWALPVCKFSSKSDNLCTGLAKIRVLSVFPSPVGKPGFSRVLLGNTGFYWVILGFTLSNMYCHVL